MALVRKRNASRKKTKKGATHMGPMEIKYEKPPVWDAVNAAFDLQGGEIFCYGNIIYVPSGGALPPELIAHEKVHREQQGDDVDGWWELYIEDAEFRLEMEMEAHIKEYRVYCLRHKWPHDRKVYLVLLGGRLASPMYGGIITTEDAMAQIKAGRKHK